MANAFQQRSSARKMIYFGLIVALFTVSLLHRKMVINATADELSLREVGRGKADLTDSALRLTLSGVRGVAVTSLWLSAIEKQKRHEWNDLEVIVDSLTRLQPRFTSPWLFQSWNLAFNVAVECDRPRDKYYYVTRGINLLCRGEEKNDPGMAVPPQDWPANPEMRHNIGFTYQLKIGQSDEAKTMRCLFDMSCIPPSQRNPDQFWETRDGRKQLNLEKFRLFCESYPRLVRRLRERLSGYEKPEAIVQFLTDNKDIPGRLEERAKMGPDQRLAEFPILPPQDPKRTYPYPDWTSESLASSVEDFDVYIAMRAWFTYAQIPLPPENPDPGARESEYDRLKHRLPKMSTVIFRSYPSRAESYFAEQLQADGWFDDSGWAITEWFEPLLRREKAGASELVVGAGQQYHSGEAWNRAFELYKQYGLRNGMYFEPATLKKLTEEASRDPHSFAGKKLAGSEQSRSLTNYDGHFYQCSVERLPEAVAARKAIFEVENTEAANPNVVNIFHERVLPQWLDLLLRHPQFRNISNVQEETYELEAKYFKLLQYYNKRFFEKSVIGLAYASPLWPPRMGDKVDSGMQVLLREAVEKKNLKVLYIRDVEGPLDQLFLLEGPRELRTLVPLAEAMARQALWPPLPETGPDFAMARFVVWPPLPGANPEIGLGARAVWPVAKPLAPIDAIGVVAGGPAACGSQPQFLMLSSAEQRKILTTAASHRHPPTGEGWTPLLPQQVIDMCRERINWMRPRNTGQPPPTQPPPPPMGGPGF